MRSNNDYSHWMKLIDVVNGHFSGRITRLGVFEREADVVTDYWIESGIPFCSLAVDLRGDLPSLQIELGTYSHNVNQVLRAAIKLSTSGEEDGIDILDGSGRTTVLRFEGAAQ